ncbi:uncharacterized protein LOC135934962 [Cloeon dipterum]|uniref:uncharacterized protein LOC135934962 n=1 Tax=Cloeon dipterum TaxID=197152 RepID=UPI00321FC85A
MKALVTCMVFLLPCLAAAWPALPAGADVGADVDQMLRKLNVSAESRLGGALMAYLQARRNTTRWQHRRNVTQNILNALTGNRGPTSNEDEDEYEDYEEYPDLELTPEAILIFVLELFGTMIGLTWGAVSTIFG